MPAHNRQYGRLTGGAYVPLCVVVLLVVWGDFGREVLSRCSPGIKSGGVELIVNY